MASKTSRVSEEIINYSNEVNRLRAELSKLKKGTIEYEVANKKLTEAISKNNKAYKELVENAGKLNAANKNHKKSLDDATKAHKAYQSTIEDSGKKTKSVFRTLIESFSPKKLASSFGTILRFVGLYKLLDAAIAVVKEVVIGSLKAFIEFESVLGNVAAVSGATGAQLKVIGEEIKNTAVETRFTATEIAELTVSLAKLGATAEEIPDLIRPIALAAQATGESITSVGEAVLKINNQFAISAANTASTAAILTDAINSSALSLNSVGTALGYVGPIAAQVGLSFSETSQYMKVLADNGFTASKIGTGLRQVFSQLKISGKPLIATLKELSEKNISLSEAIELVDVRAASQLLTLLDNIDVLEETTSVMDSLVETIRSSAAQMATTDGQLKILNTAYKNWLITVGEAINQVELLNEVIEFLDEDSANLARSQQYLDEAFKTSKGLDRYQLALKRVKVAGVDPFVAALEFMKDVGSDVNNDYVRVISELVSQLGLSEEEATRFVKVWLKNPVSKELSNIRKGLKLNSEEQTKLNRILDDYSGTLDKVREGLGVVKEIANGFQEASNSAKAADEDTQQYTFVLGLYQDRIDRIKKAQEKGIDVTQRVSDLNKEIGDDLEKEKNRLEQLKFQREEQNKLMERSRQILGYNTSDEKQALANKDEEIRLAELTIQKYKLVQGVVADLSDAEKKRIEDAKKAQIDAAKIEFEILNEKVRQTTDQIKLSEKQFEEEKKRIEEVYALRIGAASAGEEAELIKERDAKIAAAAEKSSAEIAEYYKTIGDTIGYANLKRQEFVDEANAKGWGDDQIVKLTEVYDTLGPAVASAYEALYEFGKSLAPGELAKLIEQIELGEKYSKEFKTALSDLEDEFKKDKNKKKFIKGQQELIDKTIEELKAIRSSIDVTTEAGQAAAEVIDKQIEAIEGSATSVEGSLGLVAELIKTNFVDAAKTALDAIQEFNKVSYENTLNRLNAEKEKISERADFEQDVLKSQLDSQLISQEEYQSRLEQIKKKEIQRQNAVDKKIFEEEKKRDKQTALARYLEALAQIIPNLIVTEKQADPTKLILQSIISGGLATAAYSAQVSAIDKRIFFPKKFAEGGIVNGPSHADGGVPFTVRGVGGYEMEGGEYIVNKKATAKYRSLLDEINNTKYQPKYKFATGGIVADIENRDLKQIELLEAIAEATTGTAINTGRPVRAFVSSSDLQNDTNARRIKDRNSNI